MVDRVFPGRKFLTDVFDNPSNITSYLGAGEDDDRSAVWERERRVYGFDSRETWGLDTTMLELLYERLMMFRERASEIVDLSFHKVTYRGVEYTHEVLLNMMIDKSARILHYVYDNNDESDQSDIADLTREVWEIWAIVHPYMWW